MSFTSFFAIPPKLRGLLSVSVALQAPAETDAIGQLRYLLHGLFQLADRGVYVLQELSPSESKFEILNETATETGFAFECYSESISAHFAQVLRNTMVMFHEVHHPVKEVNMVSRDLLIPLNVSLPLLGYLTMADTYPPLSNRLPFLISYDLPSVVQGSRSVRIEFVQPLTNESLAATISWLERWAEISMGAYAANEADLQSGACAIFDAIPDIDDDHSIEMTIEYFGAVSEAWYGLLNLCGRISFQLAPVQSVRIR